MTIIEELLKFCQVCEISILIQIFKKMFALEDKLISANHNATFKEKKMCLLSYKDFDIFDKILQIISF